MSHLFAIRIIERCQHAGGLRRGYPAAIFGINLTEPLEQHAWGQWRWGRQGIGLDQVTGKKVLAQYIVDVFVARSRGLVVNALKQGAEHVGEAKGVGLVSGKPG